MSAILNMSEDQRDALQEITNVAMGQAGDRLARLLDTFVVLSIPHIEIMAPQDIAMTLQSIHTNDTVSGVCQGFIGGGIAGEAILLFNDTSFTDLAHLLKYEAELNEYAERELLMDTTNVLLGACIRGFAEQIDMGFSFGPPTVLGQHQQTNKLFDADSALWRQALVTEINYKLEGYNVNCDLLLLMTDESIKRLMYKIDYLLE